MISERIWSASLTVFMPSAYSETPGIAKSFVIDPIATIK